jgi:hypothetical protein
MVESRATGREMPIVAIGSLSLMVVEAIASRPGILFGRHFFVDEFVVTFTASDPSISHSLFALRHSTDFTPPVFHLLVRGFWWLWHGSPETAFRTFSFLSMWAALVLTYAVLRRTFAILPTLIAVLALWSHPTVIHYTFMARPYSLLLATTAGFCLIYGEHRPGFGAAVLTAALAAWVCMTHYFGLFGLAAIVAVDLVTRPTAIRGMIRRLLPVSAAPIALLICLPFIRGAMQEFTVPITGWMPPFTLAVAFNDIITGFFASLIYIAIGLLLAWWISELIQQRSRENGNAVELSTVLAQPTILLSALLLVPLIQMAYSAFRDNTMMDRYMIAGLLGATPLLAALAWRSTRPLQVVAAVLLALLGVSHLRQFADAQAGVQAAQESMINQAIAENDGLPIVCFSCHEAHLLYNYAPALRPRLFIADFRSSHSAQISDALIVDYESAAPWLVGYPDMPKMATLDDLRQMGRFHLIGASYEVLSHPLKVRFDEAEAIARMFSLEGVGGGIYQVIPN